MKTAEIQMWKNSHVFIRAGRGSECKAGRGRMQPRLNEAGQ